MGPEIETLPSNPAVLQPRLLLDSVSTGGPKKTVSGKNIPNEGHYMGMEKCASLLGEARGRPKFSMSESLEKENRCIL